MAKVNPKIAVLMKKKRDAEMRGDKEEMFKANFKIAEIYKGTDAFKFKNMAVAPASTMFVFGSFFLALRRMCIHGHEPMTIGGFGPFLDLTLPDPSYILSAWTAATLFAVIKLGLDFGAANTLSTTPMQELIKKSTMLLAPAAVFWFTSVMPAGMGLYWATNNTFSIFQSLVMLQPGVRKYLKIPAIPPKVKAEKKGIKQSFKDSVMAIKNSWKNIWEDRKMRKVINESRNQFDRSGIGPLRKTFDYDPTKLNPKVKKT